MVNVKGTRNRISGTGVKKKSMECLGAVRPWHIKVLTTFRLLF